MRSVTAAGRLTVRLGCEAPLRLANASKVAPAATATSVAPAIAPRIPNLNPIRQPIEP
jgi:hypothetical protein